MKTVKLKVSSRRKNQLVLCQVVTNQCCGLAVIFCSFILHLIGRETIHIPESFSGVHGLMGKTVTHLPKFSPSMPVAWLFRLSATVLICYCDNFSQSCFVKMNLAFGLILSCVSYVEKELGRIISIYHKTLWMKKPSHCKVAASLWLLKNEKEQKTGYFSIFLCSPLLFCTVATLFMPPGHTPLRLPWFFPLLYG